MSFDPHFYSVKGDNMIDRDKTIKEFGYNPDDFKPNSCKLIYKICKSCGKEQIVQFRSHNKLCRSCAQIGKECSEETLKRLRTNFLGKKHTTETKMKMSEVKKGKIFSKTHKQNISKSKIGNKNPMFGIMGEENHSWKGGKRVAKRKDYVRRKKTLDPNPIELNKDFKGSHGHHVNDKYIINIPGEMHNSIGHKQTNGLNMHKINKLAFRYLMNNKENIIVSKESIFYINLMCL